MAAELHKSLQPQHAHLYSNQAPQIIYSDKSESSVEEGMDITPSNYNQQNGRFDGKS